MTIRTPSTAELADIAASLHMTLPPDQVQAFRDRKVRRPYSLAQVQMAWWTAIVFGSYVYLALKTGSINGILNDTALILLGIGTGTALGAAMVDQTKAAQNAGDQPPSDAAASQGLFDDLLTDCSGVTLHRFQVMVWTLLLGLLFVWQVARGAGGAGGLAMPDIDPRALGLLGISGGTYLGFKIPEQQA